MGAPGHSTQFREPAHMIDVGMRAHNCAHFQLMLPQNLKDAFNIVARINHNRFVSYRITEYRAIALQHSPPESLRV